MADNDDDSISDSYDQKIKIMILGETLVGKTAIITRYTKKVFAENYLTTVGIDFQNKQLNINGKKINVEIWDTAGQERFRNIAKTYFQSSDGFLLVYDITSKDSFNKLNDWYDQIKLNAPENSKCIIAGNKSDLEEKRQVKKEEGEQFASDHNLKFYETSAKDDKNINIVFELLSNEIVNDEKTIKRNKRSSQVLKKKNAKVEKKNCC